MKICRFSVNGIHPSELNYGRLTVSRVCLSIHTPGEEAPMKWAAINCDRPEKRRQERRPTDLIHLTSVKRHACERLPRAFNPNQMTERHVTKYYMCWHDGNVSNEMKSEISHYLHYSFRNLSVIPTGLRQGMHYTHVDICKHLTSDMRGNFGSN